MNGFDLIAQCLKEEGVDWMGCFPANALIEAAARVGIRPIVFRQERGGINAADGYARQMGGRRVGVFASQSGPGVENSFGAIAQAWGDAVPLLFLPGGAGTGSYDIKPNFSAIQNYSSVSKLAISIDQIGQTTREMRRAFHALKHGRPGPVVVEMHGDVLGREVPDQIAPYKSPKQVKAQPSRTDVKDAVSQLLSANTPVIWAGQGVLYAGASEELQELANLTQVPVITTMQAKSAFPDEHPLALGSANRTAPKAVYQWLGSSDTVLAIGSGLTRTGFGLEIPAGKFLIHSTNNAEDINKDYETDIGLLGDAKLTLSALIEEVKAQAGDNGRATDTELQNSIARTKRDWLNEWEPILTSNEQPINPYRVINEINAVVDHEKSVVTHDAGNPRDQIMPFYRSSKPYGYIGWGKTTHLGYGLPLAIGAKIADPSKFCMNFMGDLAFGHTGMEIETAVRANVPITTVIVNNKTMGGYDTKMPVAMKEYGVGNQSGDYADMAKAMGAVSMRIDDPRELNHALKQAQQENDEGNVVVVEVMTRQDVRFSQYPELLNGSK